MLTSPYPAPPNSTSPLPADWAARGAENFFTMYSAGLTVPPTLACAPGPAAFADLAPAGTMFPQVTVNPQYPALSSAVLTPAPVSPLASQVYQVQQSMQQSLTSNNGALLPAIDEAGQSGAQVPANWPGAAEVYPMSLTTNLVEERLPLDRRYRRRGPPQNPDFPGVPWGGVSVSVPHGGCDPNVGGGLSGWAKLFLLAGAAVIVYAASEK